MKVSIKVLMNRQEIQKAANEIKSAQDWNANQQFMPEGNRVMYTVPELPMEVIETKTMWIDLSDVKMASENEHGGLTILYNGHPFDIQVDDETKNKIEERFSND